jgi:hypothetical protein
MQAPEREKLAPADGVGRSTTLEKERAHRVICKNNEPKAGAVLAEPVYREVNIHLISRL